MVRQTAIVLSSILISCLLLYFLLQDVSLIEVLEKLRNVHPAWIALSFVVGVAGLLIRGIRWYFILGKQLPLRLCIYFVGITYLLNQLPLRTGEVVRCMLAQKFGISFMTAATSIVVERLFDVIVVLLIFAFIFPFVPGIPLYIQSFAQLIGIVAIVGFALMIYSSRKPQRIQSLIQTTNRVFPIFRRLPLQHWFERITDGLYPLTSLSTFTQVLTWTMSAWLATILLVYLLTHSLSITTYPLIVSALGVALVSFSTAFPINIASIGLFEGAIKLTGLLVGMSDLESTILGLVFHGIAILSQTVLGIIGILGLGLSSVDFQKWYKFNRE